MINNVSANYAATEEATSLPVTLLSVSTYVNESKEPDRGLPYVYPKQLPFSSHWGVIVGEVEPHLLHRLLEGDGPRRIVYFVVSSIRPGSRRIAGAALTTVGQTRYPIQVGLLRKISEDMIQAFGNYHFVFWNCHMFAKSYLRVITGDDVVFTQWTSADVTNLFLCALVVPMPVASTSKHRQNCKMKQLHKIGSKAADENQFGRRAEAAELTEEVFRASDRVIDLMKASW